MVVPLINRGQTLGIIGMTLKDSEFAFKRNRIELAETVASQIATAVENAKMHAQTEQALDLAERDLEIGREIQSGFFPPFLPEVPGWELAAYFKAARQVSGDFYDVFPLEHTSYVGLVVADVCDKGVGAALFMVLLRSLIRSYSEQHRKNERVAELLQNIAVKVNRYIVQTHGQSNMFATLFLGILDPAENKLYYVNGGHDAPLLVDANGQLKNELLPTGPAFGFTTDLEFEIGSCAFSPGDLLFSYTDGFTEAKNLKEDFYTDEQLVREASQAWPSAFSAIKHLELGVSSHMGEQVQFDDITLLALRRKQENEPDCHKLTQKAILPKLPLFRNFVAEVCRNWGVDSSISENLQLAVDELCSNLIFHGYEGRGQGDIHLSLRKQQDALQVQLEDEASSFDPSFLDPPVLGDDLEDRKVGGLGVFLVRELVDDLQYERKEGRNNLTLSLKI
jgi:serine phosphatase RsbU (regulator of sigma subunit)/anti-sigma regulatory factor (Ser/Thr protein kinase)